MPVLLVSHRLHAERRADLARHAATAGLEVVSLPEDASARLPDEACARVEVALFSIDIHPEHSRQFFAAVRKAPALKWLHVFNAGVDHPVFTEMLQRGVRLTTSSGTAAEPIAQTALTGLLMLSRNFPHWLAAQRDRRWDPMRRNAPVDLAGQTAVVVGLGHIGKAFSRLAQALGLKVIGVKRSARGPDDPVDELVTPDRLRDVLPRADWLVLACPLTDETRGMIDAAALAALPKTARFINVARGEIVDEDALLDALRSGRLAGAYIDVFQTEPLPPESPFWDLPNVLVTPHNSPASAGNDDRIYALFVENLARWTKGEPMINEVS